MTPPPVLAGISFVRGELELSFRDIVGFGERAAEYQMIDDAELWGWGTFYRTNASAAELAIAAGRRTIEKTGIGQREIGAVILCAAELPEGLAALTDYGRHVLDALSLPDAFVLGATLNGCATMLGAIALARDLVRVGTYANILLITSDCIDDEATRFQPFALFSDAASSCVVSREDVAGYGIIGAAAATDCTGMVVGGEISAALARSVNEKLAGQAGDVPAGVKAVLHTNLFKPIVRLKEHQAGFRASQLFLDNISRRGHCFASDPLVNLLDYAAATPLATDDRLLLASSTPGLRIGVLLRPA